jgi:hypothetical protein
VLEHATGLFATKQTAMTTINPNRENSLGTLSPVDVPIAQLPVVELNAEHIRRSGELAIDRNESYEKINGGSVYGGNDSLTSHQTGILGEMAVAKLYATDIDTETYEFGDSGIDLNLWDDASVDVKATTTNKMRYPELLVCDDNELSADLYFVAHIVHWGPSGAQVRILGYATHGQVNNKTPYRHPGSTKNYVIEPKEMTLPPLVQACDG